MPELFRQARNIENTEIDKCNEPVDITPKYGRFGYYITCNKCETNTQMKIPCVACKSKKTKVSKKKETYTLSFLEYST